MNWKAHETDNFVIIDDQPWAKWNGHWGPTSGDGKIPVSLRTDGGDYKECDSLGGIANKAASLPGFIALPRVQSMLQFIAGPLNPPMQQSYDEGNGLPFSF